MYIVSIQTIMIQIENNVFLIENSVLFGIFKIIEAQNQLPFQSKIITLNELFKYLKFDIILGYPWRNSSFPIQ